MYNQIESLFLRNLVAPLWALKEGSGYLRYIKNLKKTQYIKRELIQDKQTIKLQKIINHAYEHCPYYHELFTKNNILSSDIRSVKDLDKIPILTKETIRNNKDRMVAANIDKCQLIPKKTSGSTGVSLEFYMDVDCSEFRRAVAIFRNSWSGYKYGEKMGAIWGNPQNKQNWRVYVRNLLLDRMIYLDTLCMDEHAMLQFFYRIKRLKPSVLFGHAHSLYLFAIFLEKKGLSEKIHIKGIISTAMILHDWQRKAIETIFNCKVFNRYGCEEVSLIASECEKHEGLHINSEGLIVEFIKNGKQALPGEDATVIVTDLMNHAMPFIRYQVGDVAVYSDKICSCGRELPLIEKVIGRDADYIVTPEGKYISGISLTENLSLRIPGVKQMQIEQYEIEYLKMRIVKDSSYNNKSKIRLAELSKEIFGPSMKYECEYVDKIEQEKNGKYRFVISRIRR